KPFLPLDQVKGLSPRPNLRRLPLLIRHQLDRCRNTLPIDLSVHASLHLQYRLAILELDLAELPLLEVIRQPNIKLLARADRIDPLLQPRQSRHRQPPRLLLQVSLSFAPPFSDLFDVSRLRLRS